MNRSIIILLISLINIKCIFAIDTHPSTNMEIIDSLVEASAREITGQLEGKKIRELTLEASGHTGSWLLEQDILSRAASAGLKVYSSDTNGVYSMLRVDIRELYVEYSLYPESDDTLYRKINLLISGKIDTRKELLPLKEMEFNYKDIISREDLPHIENSPHNFAKAEAPDPNDSFLDDILEPAVLFVSSAVAVVLLFTVRSN